MLFVDELVEHLHVTGLNRAFSEHFANAHRTEVSNTFFTLHPFDDFPVDHEAVAWADVIHLHWVTGLVGPRTLRQLSVLGKPIFWTLHDVRPLTGGCHFPSGCWQFTESCQDCIQVTEYSTPVVAKLHAESMAEFDRSGITFIAPSLWMKSMAQKSSVTRGARVEHVPYGLDTQRFAPGDSVAAKAELGLDVSKKFLLLGANDRTEKRKGVAHAIQVLEAIAELGGEALLSQWELLRVGRSEEGDEPPRGWKARDLGLIPADKMPAVYRASSLMIFTPLEDNLPNMVLEAMGSGVAVIGSRAGGILDMIEHGVNGFLVDVPDNQVDAQGLVNAMLSDDALSAIARKAVEVARSRYALHIQAGAIAALYQGALQQKPSDIAQAVAAGAVPSALSLANETPAYLWPWMDEAILSLYERHRIKCVAYEKDIDLNRKLTKVSEEQRDYIGWLEGNKAHLEKEIELRQQHIDALMEGKAAMEKALEEVRLAKEEKLRKKNWWKEVIPFSKKPGK
jgi:glycosyltransferase involved in cell wall biosynthesis